MIVISAYAIGLIFGLGISFSGMANPAKVLNFFDVAGHWDPSLGLVMVAALVVTFFGYRQVFARVRPLLEPGFQMPRSRMLNAKLIGGAAVFGIGWGIAGFCPGGALPALGTGQSEVILFTVALLGGVFAAKGAMKLMHRVVMLADPKRV